MQHQRTYLENTFQIHKLDTERRYVGARLEGTHQLLIDRYHLINHRPRCWVLVLKTVFLGSFCLPYWEWSLLFSCWRLASTRATLPTYLSSPWDSFRRRLRASLVVGAGFFDPILVVLHERQIVKSHRQVRQVRVRILLRQLSANLQCLLIMLVRS